jgi:hypothetical protein
MTAMWRRDYRLADRRIAETISLPVSTEVHSAAAQSMLEALEASLNGFECDRQLRSLS